MRVVCIDTDYKAEQGSINVIKGYIYTVIDIIEVEKGYRTEAGLLAYYGTYYKLIETGCWYHNSLFVPINEQQQDENEIAHQRKSELV